LTKEEAREKGINGKSSEILSVPFTERYVPLIIAGYCPVHQNFFKLLDSQDIKLLLSAQCWVGKNIQFSTNDFEIPNGPKSDDLKNRNIHYFYQLFFPRQLIYIAESQAILATIPQKHALWMSLLLSTSLEFNAALCGYKGVDKRRPGAIRHVFSHHAYSFPYTALENNPLFYRNTSGTLGNLFKNRIVAAGEWAKSPIERRYTNHQWIKTTIPTEIDLGQESSSFSDFSGQSRMFLVSRNDSTQMPLPSKSSVHIMNLRALKHDTILVLKPRGPRKKDQWQKPEPIEGFDSYSFCKACGNMMGWILEQDMSEHDIAKAWTDFLGRPGTDF
jgi:putative DNA methylase